MKNCPNCGTELSDRDDCCYMCGHIMQQGTNRVANTSSDNQMAVTALICAFLIPILGIIYGIKGVKIANELNGKRKNMAIAAIVISCIWILLSLITYSAFLMLIS